MRTKFIRSGWALVAGVTVLASMALSPLASADTATHATTQKAIDNLRIADDAPGSAAVVRAGGTLWSLTSGTKMENQNAPFGPHDRTRVGSLTKSFTAAVVLQLVAENRVNLDASVETYLPGVVNGNGYDGTKITVRQLLSHTSGIFDYLEALESDPANLAAQQNRTHTLAELASWGLSKPQYFAPGAGYHYSGTGYMLLGMIIEKLTGNSYAQELNSRIITPLGLSDTYLPVPGDKNLPDGGVHGYITRSVFGFQFFVDLTSVVEPSMGISGGGLVTSGADATTFYQALMAGKVVPAAQLAEMIKPTNAPGSSAPNYGLGMDRFDLPCGGSAWGHYGRWFGYASIAAATPDGRAAFVTTNVLDMVADTSNGSGASSKVLNDTLATALCDQG
ncbi:beta-lactamase family protein [Solihabitans fulvus]|uniref:Beta-lactamase family protein n=1 Tax=Solihabitans fulvus TaxID=1892852 RepID=A0A5B2WTY1_9PSEU|nr:serine hydrolase domain-containing protein [Solihabitans fulvus]KAA2253889.1 beta-lactamase family protein [Solihabitans fulvus]